MSEAKPPAPKVPAPKAPAPVAPQVSEDALWAQMPDEVRFVLRRKIATDGPLDAMKEIGRHWQGGRWSITPYPGTLHGFGSIGMREAASLVKRLRDG